MKNSISNQDIQDYYNTTQILYNMFWSNNALHYGLWNKHTKNIKDAINNTNQIIIEKLKINPNDIVLDAGCGIGGSCIFISKKSGAKVTGITISEVQLKKAKKNAIQNSHDNTIRFLNQDFTKTNFPNESFSKIYGIESICHAKNKADFLKEAMRILKQNGKIAIVDAFLIENKLSKKGEKIYNTFLKGWALPNLISIREFSNLLNEVGFKNIQYEDKIKEVKKSSLRIYYLGILGIIPIALLTFFGITPKTMIQHTISSIYQRKLVNKKIATYGIFTAEK